MTYGCSMTSRTRRSKSSPSSPRPKPRNGSKSGGRKSRAVPLAKVKDDLSHYLRLAEGEEIVITRHGRAAGALIGFESDEDWFDYPPGESSGVSCPSSRGSGGPAGWQRASPRRSI